MKINIIHRSGYHASISLTSGFVNAIKDLGHDVDVFVSGKLDFHNSGKETHLEKFVAFLKKPCDILIVVGGSEKFTPLYANPEVMELFESLPCKKVGFITEGITSRTIIYEKTIKSVHLWTHIIVVDPLDEEILRRHTDVPILWIQGMVDEAFFKPIGLQKKYDVKFIGTIHMCRESYIELLSKTCNFSFNEEVTNEEYVELIDQSKILIGLPAPFKGFTGRVFEAMATKTFILNYYPSNRPEMLSVFSESELITYKSDHDLLYKIRYYLEHEDERQEIVENAYRRILSDFTCKKQSERILNFVGITSK